MQHRMSCRALLVALLMVASMLPGAPSAQIASAADGPYSGYLNLGNSQYTSSVVVADLNGDGTLDIILGSAGFQRQIVGKSQVYLNDGHSNFTAIDPPINPNGSSTYSVAAGDLNGDGTIDLVLGNYGQPSQVYMNDGTGRFSPALDQLNPAGNNTGRVALGDLNGDGSLDIVLANNGQPSQVYFNNGSGSFSPAISLNSYGISTSGLALGDLNGDGKLDIVLGNTGQPSQVYLNDGLGNFYPTPTTINPAGNLTNSVALGDLNGDGSLDIVLGNGSPQSNQPSQVYLNDGQGNFSPTTTALNPGGNFTSSIVVGDFNGDGALDLVLGNVVQSGQIYLNQGNGNFTQVGVINPTGVFYTRSIALGDLNGDSMPDLVLGNTGQPSQIVLHNGFNMPFITPLNGINDNSHSVAVGDLNGDGALDLILGNLGQPSQIYFNDSTGHFSSTPTLLNPPYGNNTYSVAVGDLNGDGALDIVLGNAGQPSQVYLNDGTGHFPTATSLNPYGNNTYSVAIGDLNGDGALDLVLGNSGQPSQVYFNDGAGHFPTATAINPKGNDTNSVALGDLNNDGTLDLVLGNYDQPSQVYLNDRHGNFSPTAAQINPNGNYTFKVAVGDLNGDGALDIVLGNGGTIIETSQVYLNDGKGSFKPTVAPLNLEGNFTMDMALGDLNNDGALDILVGNGGFINNSPVSRWSMVYLNRNDGTGDFLPAYQLNPNGGNATGGVAMGDLNGDGTLDLVLSNINQPSLVYLSHKPASTRLLNNPPVIGVTRPGRTHNADFYSTPEILSSRIIPIPFTLADPDGDPVREVRGEYSLDGGGTWKPAVATNQTNLDAYPTYNLVYPQLMGWINITTTGTALNLGDDSIAGPLPLGFGLPLYTQASNQIWVSSNGWLSLRAPSNAKPMNSCLPNATAPPGMIAPFWDDLNPSAGGQIYYQQVDANTFVVEYYQIPHYSVSGSGTYTFEVVLRRDGSITFQYLTMSGTLNSATIGVQNQEGSHSTQLACDTAFARSSGAVRLQPGGQQHTFNWDTFASGVFGQSDNVVVRLIALPALTSGQNGVPLFQYPSAVATTFPFRVCGTQVRVIDDQQPPHPMPDAIVFRLNDTLPLDQQLFAPSSTAPAYTSDSLGYLPGRGTLALTDTLIALAPVPLPGPYSDAYSPTVRLYATNIITTPAGVSGFTVTQSGVQTVTVSLEHPLALFDLGVSVEWDARYDARFTAQLQADLARASELLFQSSHGQAALGRVTIFYDRENWDDADIRIYASNRVRPSAMIGGVATSVITDPTTLNTVIYGLGQVHMGAIWNRFGSSNGNLSDDWPRTLVHELSHYLFFLGDNYLGLVQGQVVPVSSCPGLMGDLYASIWQYQTRAGWNPGCATTFSNQATKRADWETMTTFYPALRPPGLAVGTLPPGPIRLPLALTEIDAVDPLTATARLAVPIFYTVDDAGGRVIPALTARAYLFQHSHGESSSDYTQLTPLGRANNDQVLARGARVGDKICLFEPTAARFGCETIRAGREQLTLHHRPAWQPDIQVTPVNSITLDVMVTGLPPGTNVLTATLYPLNDDPQPDPATISDAGSGIYRGTFTLKYPLPNAYIHLETADRAPNGEPIWETVTNFAMDGNAGGYNRMGGGGYNRMGGGGYNRMGGGGYNRMGGGGYNRMGGGGYNRIGGGGYNRMGGGSFIRTGAAPVSSAEGDVQLVGTNLSFALGQFLLFQTTSSLPALPSWATLIGQGYRFTTSPAPNTPSLTSSVLSFSYLDSEVPAGEETGIQVYYRNPTASAWTPITTTLDTYFNLASIPTQGPGLYALMSSLVSDLAPGWSMIGYPSQVAWPVASAMAPVAGKYRAVYHYNPGKPSDPWDFYSPTVPSWVNTPGLCMSFGQGYWVASTSATTETLRFRSSLTPGETTSCPTTAALDSGEPPPQALAATIPPATYYGSVASTQGLNAASGLPVVARVGDVVCGTGTTYLAGGQVVYYVHVGGATADTPGCGQPGRSVSFTVKGVTVGSAAWGNDALHPLNLPVSHPGAQVFLPLIRR